jgi:hypothetical protein
VALRVTKSAEVGRSSHFWTEYRFKTPLLGPGPSLRPASEKQRLKARSSNRKLAQSGKGRALVWFDCQREAHVFKVSRIRSIPYRKTGGMAIWITDT